MGPCESQPEILSFPLLTHQPTVSGPGAGKLYWGVGADGGMCLCLPPPPSLGSSLQVYLKN